MQKKTLILILVCIVLSIALATGAAFLLVHITKKGLSEESASSGPESTVSDVSSALPVVAEPVPEPEIGLSFSSPQDNTVTTTDAFFRFAGGSDPAQPVLMNGTEIERNADGSFSLDVNLSVGKNEFTFTHKGQTVTKTIQYRYVIIQSYSPRGNQSFESGATFRVTVRARAGSAVYSEFHGETIRLTRTELQEDDTLTQSDDFADFIGQFTLPGDNAANLSLGKVWVSANYNGSTERFSSGNITCKKAQIHIVPDDTIPPNNKNYNAVGAGYIAEIVGYTAETFTTSATSSKLLPLMACS